MSQANRRNLPFPFLALCLSFAILVQPSYARADNPSASEFCEFAKGGLACATFRSCAGLIRNLMPHAWGTQGLPSALISEVAGEMDESVRKSCANPSDSNTLVGTLEADCESACDSKARGTIKRVADIALAIGECKVACLTMNATHFAFVYGYRRGAGR
jgi:hypothetical protein